MELVKRHSTWCHTVDEFCSNGCTDMLILCNDSVHTEISSLVTRQSIKDKIANYMGADVLWS